MDYNMSLKSANYIKSKIKIEPKLALILGTGLGSLSESIEEAVVIDYESIPNFLVSTNKDHAGKLIIGKLYGKDVICMSGRFHYYEGYSYEQLAIPIKVFKLLGVEKIIVTNAAGGINTDFKAGDIMLINDHINFVGVSPMRGENIEQFGDRFFDLTNAYDKELREMAKGHADNIGVTVREGVYGFATGPHFETPAEIRFMRIVGADAVGMSTVPEVITAAWCGIKVLGFSLISNMAAGVLDKPITTEEVEEVAMENKDKLHKFFKAIVETI